MAARAAPLTLLVLRRRQSIRDRIAALTGGGSGKEPVSPKEVVAVGSGKEIRAGWAHKLAAMNTSHKRWCVITADQTLAFYAEEAKTTLKGSTSLAGCTISSADSIFQVLPAGKSAALKFKVTGSPLSNGVWRVALRRHDRASRPRGRPSRRPKRPSGSRPCTKLAAQRRRLHPLPQYHSQ